MIAFMIGFGFAGVIINFSLMAATGTLTSFQLGHLVLSFTFIFMAGFITLARKFGYDPLSE